MSRNANGHFAPGNDIGAETRIKPGTTPNPGGQPKTRKELRMLARGGLPKAFERALQILNDDKAEWRAWLEAGKFLAAYGYGAPPKLEKDDDAERPERTSLTVEERRAIARMKLSTEAPADAVRPQSEPTEH